MSTLTAISLDPGRVTGHARGRIEDGTMYVSSNQTAFDHASLWANLHLAKPDFIICESFEFRTGNRARTRVDLYPCELIGVISLYDALTPNCIVYWQKPSQALGGYYSDDKLKKESLYKSTKGGHANDAVRHLLQWFHFGAGYKHNVGGFEPDGK